LFLMRPCFKRSIPRFLVSSVCFFSAFGKRSSTKPFLLFPRQIHTSFPSLGFSKPTNYRFLESFLPPCFFLVLVSLLPRYNCFYLACYLCLLSPPKTSDLPGFSAKRCLPRPGAAHLAASSFGQLRWQPPPPQTFFTALNLFTAVCRPPVLFFFLFFVLATCEVHACFPPSQRWRG